MKAFTLDAFSKHLEKVITQYPKRELEALTFLGKSLEEEAKYKIGHLQEGAGPFVDWAELAESTIQDKIRKGYNFNSEYNPLFRTGELRDSIHYVINVPQHKLILGSDSEIMVYQELGTAHIPPRSVLGLTMFKAKYEIEYVLTLFLKSWILNERAIYKKIH